MCRWIETVIISLYLFSKLTNEMIGLNKLGTEQVDKYFMWDSNWNVIDYMKNVITESCTAYIW